MSAAFSTTDGADEMDGAQDADLTEAMFALRALMLAGEQFRHAVADHFGVGLSETVAMSHLSASGPLSPREVASKLSLTPSAVTSLLDRLESDGLAERSAHPTDRRRSVVTLTGHGEQMLVRVRQWMRAALGALDETRLPEVGAVLVDLATALNAQTERITSRRAGARGLRGGAAQAG